MNDKLFYFLMAFLMLVCTVLGFIVLYFLVCIVVTGAFQVAEWFLTGLAV